MEETGEEGAGPWPAFADLMSATTLLFLVLFAVIAIPAIQAAGKSKEAETTLQSLDTLLIHQDFVVRKPGDYLIVTIGGADTFPQKRYDLNSLSPRTLQTLDRLAGILKSNADKIDQIHVVGHTSSEGKDSTNWRLSSNRAGTVALYFINHGNLSACKITALGRGKYYPVDTVAAHASRDPSPLDRRIEIEIRPVVSDTAQVHQRQRCVEMPGDRSEAAKKP
jgi:outer membrane protein OmpA-like peptidoglycan-associated protein